MNEYTFFPKGERRRIVSVQQKIIQYKHTIVESHDLQLHNNKGRKEVGT